MLLFFSTGREERKKGRKEGRRKEGLESLSLFLVPLTGLVCVGRVGGCRCPYQGHVSIPRNNEDFNAVAREDVPGMRLVSSCHVVGEELPVVPFETRQRDLAPPGSDSIVGEEGVGGGGHEDDLSCAKYVCVEGRGGVCIRECACVCMCIYIYIVCCTAWE